MPKSTMEEIIIGICLLLWIPVVKILEIVGKTFGLANGTDF